MVLAPRLQLRISQRLILTPQLRQAIEILQLNNIELRSFLDQELEQNPLLEMETSVNPVIPGAAISQIQPQFGNLKHHHWKLDDTNDFRGSKKRNNSHTSANTTFPAHHNNISGHGAVGNVNMERTHTDVDNMLNTVSRSTTLRDHLREQLNFEVTDRTDYTIGLHLIDLVNEEGYLTENIETVAVQLGCKQTQIALVLSQLQHFDPPGVFARNLGECLKLQIRELDWLNPATEILLDNLKLLAERNFPALIKLCAISINEINDIAEQIKTLNPKPGLTFHQELSQPLIPDVYTWRQRDGSWMVELNNNTLPNILVNSHYHARVARMVKSKSEKHYLAEQLQSANWLVRSLDQRAKTILTVTRELIRQQKEFLIKGVLYLKPLTLRTIAHNVKMHESTVSRTTAGKYLATPSGIFLFRYFFDSPIRSILGGNAHSAKAVRYMIKCLIEQELPDTVMSDNHIAATLRYKGVNIARRTVAKYREAMRIPSSVQRRRMKK